MAEVEHLVAGGSDEAKVLGDHRIPAAFQGEASTGFPRWSMSGENGGEHPSQIGGITRRTQDVVVEALEQLGDAAHSTRDHWRRTGQRFEGHQTESLKGGGWDDRAVRRPIGVGESIVG